MRVEITRPCWHYRRQAKKNRGKARSQVRFEERNQSTEMVLRRVLTRIHLWSSAKVLVIWIYLCTCPLGLRTADQNVRCPL